MRRLRPQLTYANVVATLALFLVLGGGAAFAATQLPKNSVGARQIVAGAVTPVKLSRAARAGLAGPAGHAGPAGVQGPRGPEGEAGARGEPGAAATFATPEEVQPVSKFEHGFVNSGSGTLAAGYYLDRQCEVHLQGEISGEEGRVAFTLPAGYRPSALIVQAVPTNSEDGLVLVQAEGQVSFTRPSGGTAAWSLSGVSFRVAGC